MSSRMPSDQKKDGMVEIVGAILLAFVVLTALIWMAASNRIVYYGAPVFAWFGQAWALLPGGEERAAGIARMALEMRAKPLEFGYFDWMSYVGICLKPTMMFISGLLIMFLVATLLRSKPYLRMNFSKNPDRLLEGMSHVFTGIAPILHLRKDLVTNKDPLWQRQTFPEDVLLKERVGGKPLVVDDQLDRARAEAYFAGLEKQAIEGRPVSRMLGRLIVDLVADRGRKPVPVYPDRFSPVGKVIYALLCAHAFGDKADYERARDQLNNSCRGAKSGMPNLTVAQWLFDKYRSNPMAIKLFAMHHWEYTFLFALFIEAKKKGKVTHAEFLWLKPTCRILFYALNTVGRRVPHTESAAVFNQFAFERRAARMSLLPLMRDAQGAYRPSIFVRGAVEGLNLEWERWRDGEDDEEEWWKDKDVWSQINGALRTINPTPAASPGADTEFDRAQRSAQAAADQRENDRLAAAVSEIAAGRH